MAIFDSASEGQLNSISITVAHTCSGTNRVLIVGVTPSAGTITGVTYNGVSMTQVNTGLLAGFQPAYLFLLINPSSGTNNIIATGTSSSFIYLSASSYTSAHQTIQPDANQVSTGTGSSTSNTLTTLINNSLQVGAFFSSSNSTITAGTNTVLRTSGAFGRLAFFEKSAITTPAGSTTLSANSSTGGDWIFLGLGIRNFVSTANTGMLAFFLGA